MKYLCNKRSISKPLKLIEAEWRKYASVNQAIIGSDNELSPVRSQTIIRTNIGSLLIWPLPFEELIGVSKDLL